METYRVSGEGLNNMKNRMKKINRTMGIIFCSILMIIFILGLTKNGEMDLGLIVFTSLTFLIIFSIISILVGKRTLAQLENSWKSIEFIIGDDFIERRQANLPDLKIRFNEIKELNENSAGLSIKTANKFNYIVITKEVDNYNTLKETILNKTTGDIREGKNFKNNLIMILITIIFVLACLASMLSMNIFIVLPAGVIVIIGNIFFSKDIKKDKHVEKKKKIMLIVFQYYISILAIFKIITLTFK